MASYLYAAQTINGQTLTGVMTAESQPAAQQLLERLQLRIMSLEAQVTGRPRGKPISANDFQAFNQQLASLSAAGLPLEQGLRLMAEDMGHGRLAGTTRAVADEMAQGATLEDAFARHEKEFPPMYSRLVAAGIKTNNLPGMLLNLGRHVELIAALRASIWRAVAYPFMLFMAMGVVLTFVCWRVLPQFGYIFNDFRTTLPDLTQFLLWIGPAVPWIFGGIFLLVVGIPLWAELLRLMGVGGGATGVLGALPLLGAVIRRNQLARWCDALRIGVEAGLGLPEALELAGDAVGSVGARADSKVLAEHVSAGRSVGEVGRLRLLPATIPAAMSMGIEQNDLGRVLANMAEMYQQQARQRMTTLPAVVTMVLMFAFAGSIVIVIMGLFLPLVKLIQSVSGDH